MEKKYEPKEQCQLLTLEDVGWMLSMGKGEARRLLVAGELPPPMKFGKLLRWHRGDIQSLVERKRKILIDEFYYKFNPAKVDPTASPATDVPEELQTVQGAIQEYHGFAHAHCVYFLLRLGVVVYVGKTKQLGIRVGQHLKGSNKTPKKDFTRVLYMLVEPDKVDAAEVYYIKTLTPEYNLTGIENED